jgi:hypothetical protein
MLSCVSAAGQVVPPFIVFEGKSMSEDVLEDALPGAEVRCFFFFYTIALCCLKKKVPTGDVGYSKLILH